jgi:hypothetical protein
VLDDTDMSLLRILDGDGYISQNVSMDAFITLMNRSIDDNKFRTLMLDILSVYTTQECQLHFVQNGGYKILKNWEQLSSDNLTDIAWGNVISFFTAAIAVTYFIKIVQRTGFKWFGVYRIIIGSIFLLTLYL